MATEKEVLLIDIKVEAGKALADATAQKKAIQDLKMANADLNTQNKELSKDELTNAAAIKANTQAIILNEAQIKSRTLQLNADMRVLQDTTKGTTEATGAYKILNDQYRTATQLAKDMAVAYGSNSTQAKEATSAAKKMSDQLKEVDDSVGQNQRNVGNYNGMLGIMPGKFGSIVQAAAGFSTSLKEIGGGMSKTQKNAEDYNGTLVRVGDTSGLFPARIANMGKGLMSLVAPFKAVIVQMWAMVANPIGAVIAAVALVLGGLYLVFKDFKPIVDKVEQALAAVAAVFATVKNVIIGLLTGQKSLKESTEGLGKSMVDAANAAMALKKAQQELEDSQAGLEEQNKRDETLIQRLMLQSKNRTLAEKDRIALLEQAQKVSDRIFQRNKKQNDDEIANAEEALRIKMKLSASEMKQLKLVGSAYAEKMQDLRGTSAKEIETLSAALLKREDIRQQDIAIQEKAQNKIDTLADTAEANRIKKEAKATADAEKRAEKKKAAEAKAIADREKKHDDEIKKDETTLQIHLAENEKVTFESARKTFNIEQEIIDKKVKYGKMTAEEEDLARIQSSNNYQKTINDIANKAIEDNKKRIDTLLKDEQAYYDEEEAISKAASDKMVKQREEVDKIVADNKKALAEMNGLEIFDYQQNQLRLQMEAELATVGLTEEQKKLIRERYRQEDLAIESQQINAKLGLAATMVNSLSGIFDQGTVAAKGIASAAIAIDGIAGAFAAYNKMAASAIPVPFNFIAGGVAAAGVAAASAVAISKVWAVKKDQRAVNAGVSVSGTSMPSVTQTPSGTQGAGLVNRTSEQAAISQSGASVSDQVAQGVSKALKDNPMRPVAFTNDITDKFAEKDRVRFDNSL